jgi:hypothetical protein
MAYTTINKHTDYFNTKLWSGNGSSQALTGVGHQTDMVWIKSRTDTRKHNMYDVVRGVQKRLVPNDTAAEDTVPGVTAFGTDGFTVGSETDTNGSSRNFVGWSWSAGASAGSSNTDGSITSTVSANTTAGFSIVTFTTSSSGSADTIGHGLGVEPSLVICKATSASDNWFVYHKSLGATKRTRLNLTNATDTNTIWNDTAPTSNVFSLRLTNFGTSRSGVAYCFAEKKGYSKFGSYTGNGNADGTFVYTGFKPAFIILKKTSDTANWMMYDNKREGYNVDNDHLKPNTNEAEGTSDDLDILSNGFKLRTSGSGENSGNFIYMAFGQSLVGSNNVPCTAR